MNVTVFSISSIKMTQFIHFSDTIYKFLGIKTTQFINYDTIYKS